MIHSKLNNEYFGEFPYCNNCKNFINELKCKAFDNIPNKILFNDVKHDKPIKGQKGDFVFEPVK